MTELRSEKGPGIGRPVRAWLDRGDWRQYFQWDEGAERYLRSSWPQAVRPADQPTLVPENHWIPAADGNASIVESIIADDLGHVESMLVQYDNGYWLDMDRIVGEDTNWYWRIMHSEEGHDWFTVADGDFTVNVDSEAVKRNGEDFAAAHKAMTAAAAWFTRSETPDTEPAG